MFINIQDEVLEFDNDPQKIDQIFKVINEYLDTRKIRFSYLIIDGTTIYEDFYTYFIDNIKNIDKVEVVLQTTTELVNETILTARNYIKNAIPLISGLAKEFYQQPDEKTWLKLSDLFEGIQWLIESLTQIDSVKDLGKIVNNYEIWNEYVQGVTQLGVIIPELEGAIVGKDIITVGDMLMYEIMPVFENMLGKLQFLLPKMEDASVS